MVAIEPCFNLEVLIIRHASQFFKRLLFRPPSQAHKYTSKHKGYYQHYSTNLKQVMFIQACFQTFLYFWQNILEQEVLAILVFLSLIFVVQLNVIRQFQLVKIEDIRIDRNHGNDIFPLGDCTCNLQTYKVYAFVFLPYFLTIGLATFAFLCYEGSFKGRKVFYRASCQSLIPLRFFLFDIRQGTGSNDGNKVGTGIQSPHNLQIEPAVQILLVETHKTFIARSFQQRKQMLCFVGCIVMTIGDEYFIISVGHICSIYVALYP